MMKKQPKKKAKQDTDAAIMESLYTADGSLPTQYTAWTPGSSPAPSATRAAVQDAAKQFSDELNGFAQVSMHRLILDAASHKEHHKGTPALIQESTSNSDSKTLWVANAVLEHFGEELQSQALRQLAKARLNLPKLMALDRKLHAVDPLMHPSTTPKGKQGDALRWCKYFESNEPSTPALHSTRVRAEKAADDLEEAAARRTVLLEEIAARTQLEKTVAQDMQGLSSLLQAVKQSHDDTLVQRQLADQGTTDEAAAEVVNGVSAARTQLEDVVGSALQARSEVQAVERKRISKLNAEVAAATEVWSQRKAAATQAQAAVKAAEQSLAKVAAKCDFTAAQFSQRQHQGHMEIRAITAAIRLLGGKVAA